MTEDEGRHAAAAAERDGEKAKDGDSDGPAVGTRFSAREIHDNVLHTAEEELERPAAALAWSSLAAGLTIGFSFLAGAFARSIAPPGLEHAASSAAYPIGFIFVVLARQQLFTENTLEPVIPLLDHFSGRMLLRVLRLYAIVLAGNLVGALLFALVFARTGAVSALAREQMDAIALHATAGGFGLVFYQAIFAGWLVALMAWLVSSTRLTGAQIVLIWLTTAPIAAFGFRHSVAGAVEALYRAARGDAPWWAMVGGFIVPAVLGNIVGGSTLVALLNHGQVKADEAAEKEKRGWGGRWQRFE